MKIHIFAVVVAPASIILGLIAILLMGQHFEFVRYLIVYIFLTSSFPFIFSNLINIFIFQSFKRRTAWIFFLGSILIYSILFWSFLLFSTPNNSYIDQATVFFFGIAGDLRR